MTAPGRWTDEKPSAAGVADRKPPPEVRPYLVRLLLCIALGIVAMTLTVVWAWNRYGQGLEQVEPLPEHARPAPILR